MKLKLSISLLIPILLAACTKEEDLGILKGDIVGKITLYNQYGYLERISTQVTVSAKSETLNQTTITDNQGYYKLSPVPIGNYRIAIQAEGYVASNSPIQHIGGKSPTLANYQLEQIPTIEIALDSLKKDTEYRAYCRLLNSDTKPQLYFGFICFLGNTPEVSKTNYQFKLNSYCLTSDFTGNSFKMTIPYLEGYMNTLGSDTQYLRVYPIALGHAYDADVIPALGKPSNVFIIKYKR